MIKYDEQAICALIASIAAGVDNPLLYYFCNLYALKFKALGSGH